MGALRWCSGFEWKSERIYALYVACRATVSASEQAHYTVIAFSYKLISTSQLGKMLPETMGGNPAPL